MKWWWRGLGGGTAEGKTAEKCYQKCCRELEDFTRGPSLNPTDYAKGLLSGSIPEELNLDFQGPQQSPPGACWP